MSPLLGRLAVISAEFWSAVPPVEPPIGGPVTGTIVFVSLNHTMLLLQNGNLINLDLKYINVLAQGTIL